MVLFNNQHPSSSANDLYCSISRYGNDRKLAKRNRWPGWIDRVMGYWDYFCLTDNKYHHPNTSWYILLYSLWLFLWIPTRLAGYLHSRSYRLLFLLHPFQAIWQNSNREPCREEADESSGELQQKTSRAKLLFDDEFFNVELVWFCLLWIRTYKNCMEKVFTRTDL